MQLTVQIKFQNTSMDNTPKKNLTCYLPTHGYLNVDSASPLFLRHNDLQLFRNNCQYIFEFFERTTGDHWKNIRTWEKSGDDGKIGFSADALQFNECCHKRENLRCKTWLFKTNKIAPKEYKTIHWTRDLWAQMAIWWKSPVSSSIDYNSSPSTTPNGSFCTFLCILLFDKSF